jgi:hypothetical protein
MQRWIREHSMFLPDIFLEKVGRTQAAALVAHLHSFYKVPYSPSVGLATYFSMYDVKHTSSTFIGGRNQ